MPAPTNLKNINSVSPKVSICVPNLNTRPYLPERFQTIFNQTFQDWEVVVYDSYSDDGAWEYIQELAAREPRMRISQGPREGTPGSWNPCIQQAQGEYVYIATSDDTMSPDCLEKLVAALDQHPDCGMAHCCLDFIDAQGAKISTGHCWENWPTTVFLGEWNGRRHIRPQGHDTVMALGLKTPYYSITQVLIRRSLFETVGMFEKRFGPFGDLEWQLRAALATKTIHVPEYLATWRVHPQQASQWDRYAKAVRDGWFLDMADEAIKFSSDKQWPAPGGLPPRLRRFYWDECVSARLGAARTPLEKFRTLFASCRADKNMIWPFVQSRFYRHILGRELDIAVEVRKELRQLGLEMLQPVNEKPVSKSNN
jgi:GT2 family glycosyltransferase